MSKKLIMAASFEVEVMDGRSLLEHYESNHPIDIGGFEITKNGASIPFDFESVTYELMPDESGAYGYTNERGGFDKIHDVDPCHEEEWKKAGLTKEDITAPFLASADELTDFYFCIQNESETEVLPHLLWVRDIVFEDENGNTYEMDQGVLSRYNIGRLLNSVISFIGDPSQCYEAHAWQMKNDEPKLQALYDEMFPVLVSNYFDKREERYKHLIHKAEYRNAVVKLLVEMKQVVSDPTSKELFLFLKKQLHDYLL